MDQISAEAEGSTIGADTGDRPGPPSGATGPCPVPEADVFRFDEVDQAGGRAHGPPVRRGMTLVFDGRGIEIAGPEPHRTRLRAVVRGHLGLVRSGGRRRRTGGPRPPSRWSRPPAWSGTWCGRTAPRRWRCRRWRSGSTVGRRAAGGRGDGRRRTGTASAGLPGPAPPAGPPCRTRPRRPPSPANPRRRAGIGHGPPADPPDGHLGRGRSASWSAVSAWPSDCPLTGRAAGTDPAPARRPAPAADQRLAEALMLTKADLPAGWRVANGGVTGTSPTVQRGEDRHHPVAGRVHGDHRGPGGRGPRWPGRRPDGPDLVPDLHGAHRVGVRRFGVGAPDGGHRGPQPSRRTGRLRAPRQPEVPQLRGHRVGRRAPAGRRPDIGDRRPTGTGDGVAGHPAQSGRGAADWPAHDLHRQGRGRPTSRCRWRPSRWGPTGSRPACRSSPSAVRSRMTPWPLRCRPSSSGWRPAARAPSSEPPRVRPVDRPSGVASLRSGGGQQWDDHHACRWAVAGVNGRIAGPEILATCGRRRQDGRTDARRRGEPSAIMRRSP